MMKKITLFFISLLTFCYGYAQDLVMTVSVPSGTTSCRLSGAFWGWDPAGGPVGVDNGNDTFTFTLSPAPGANMEYLYTINGSGVYEDLKDNAANSECTGRINSGNMVTDYSSYANRVWKTSDSLIWNEIYDDCSEATISNEVNSNYCSTEIFHLGLPAEVNSAVNLTIEKTSATTTKITVAASDITFLDIIGTPIAGGAATKSANDTSVSGEISTTLTWASTPPTDVVIQFIQWRKTSTGGATWQFNNATTPFEGVCGPAALPEEDTSLSDLQIDNVTISGFSSTTKDYTVELPDASSIPQVTLVTPTNTNATVGTITQASAVPGSATFNVTAENNVNVATYTINFIIPSPQVAAPTPPARNAADVVSIYSDAYAVIPAINLDQGWCGANAIAATTADGNAVLAYKNQACQGIDFDANRQDLTGFTHLHVDLFVKAGTDLVGKVFNIKTVPGTGAESVFPIDLNALNPQPVPGTWYSYDMPITFSGPTAATRQVGITSNLNNVVWYDNLYFHKNTTLAIKNFEIAGLNVYPNPAQDSWTVKTQNIKMSSIEVFDILGKNVISLKPETTEATINASQLKSGLYFAKINTANGSNSLKLVKQ
ncbi:T9SS type A sorting domain-containing protein [Siansivirga zeaxanthinifaciens]|nr:T9SS type A sorting domain-containing protein [Siansivirga zeaxanthinifaciens]